MELISAIATAQGSGGVAIVRVSGENAAELAKAMFSRSEFEPNVLYPGKIDCGAFSDYGMCVYFRGPHSFTGEDVVEFHCHGGAEIARGVLRRTISLGARAAEAGEFTRRAFLNGKLSLSAVEGMGEMIAAQSAAQVRAGYLLYTEALTNAGKEMQRAVKECLALTDADADFPEEDLSQDVCGEVKKRTEQIISSLDTLLNQYSAGRKIRSGVHIVICGRPNAGKSSLLNALLGYERAIVSPVPGTTRDFLEESIELHGVLFFLTDTAGLRSGADELEREGIRRAENAMRAADLIVYLKEEGDEISFPPDATVITVGAKSDLKKTEGCDLQISSKTGEGIEALKELLYERGFGSEHDGAFVLEERQYQALSDARNALAAARKGADEGLFSELFAQDLRSAYLALGRISGETASEEVIREIFARFCVGK